MPVDISRILAQTQEDIPALNQYNPLWGYYTFSQNINFDYGESRTGISKVEITINGKFILNSEIAIDSSIESKTDEEKCDILIAKYNTLRDIVLEKAKYAEPSDISSIGTSGDQRCIELPDKLLNNKGNVVYCIVNSLSIVSLSPKILEYTCSLVEPETKPCKIKLESNIISNASLVINCRKPRLQYRTFFYTNGGEACCSGITNRVLKLDGIVKEDTSNSSEDWNFSTSSELFDSIRQNGRYNLKIEKFNGEEDVFSELILNSISSGVSKKTGDSTISIEGEETQISS